MKTDELAARLDEEFGIATNAVDPDSASERCVMCSPAYVAPEIVLQRGVDGRADVFALGLILRGCVARGDRPAELERILELATDPWPEHRYTARAFEEALSGTLRETVGYSPSGAGSSEAAAGSSVSSTSAAASAAAAASASAAASSAS